MRRTAQRETNPRNGRTAQCVSLALCSAVSHSQALTFEVASAYLCQLVPIKFQYQILIMPRLSVNLFIMASAILVAELLVLSVHWPTPYYFAWLHRSHVCASLISCVAIIIDL